MEFSRNSFCPRPLARFTRHTVPQFEAYPYNKAIRAQKRTKRPPGCRKYDY